MLYTFLKIKRYPVSSLDLLVPRVLCGLCFHGRRILLLMHTHPWFTLTSFTFTFTFKSSIFTSTFSLSLPSNTHLLLYLNCLWYNHKPEDKLSWFWLNSYFEQDCELTCSDQFNLKYNDTFHIVIVAFHCNARKIITNTLPNGRL